MGNHWRFLPPEWHDQISQWLILKAQEENGGRKMRWQKPVVGAQRRPIAIGMNRQKWNLRARPHRTCDLELKKERCVLARWQETESRGRVQFVKSVFWEDRPKRTWDGIDINRYNASPRVSRRITWEDFYSTWAPHRSANSEFLRQTLCVWMYILGERNSPDESGSNIWLRIQEMEYSSQTFLSQENSIITKKWKTKY